MTKHLTPKEKAQCKVILSLLVCSLLIQQVGQKVLEPENPGDLPAVVECIKMIDELLASIEEDRRNLMVERIQLVRINLTKRTSKMEISGALIGALQYLTSSKVKTKPGTRLAYIVETFADNLVQLQKVIPEQKTVAEKFKRELSKAIQQV